MELIEKLLKKVANQMGDNWEEELVSVYKHGANAGWSGFIYYTDTVNFYNKNRKLILRYIFEISEQFSSLNELIKAMFRYEGGQKAEFDEVMRVLCNVQTDDDSETIVKDWISKCILADVAQYYCEVVNPENEEENE